MQNKKQGYSLLALKLIHEDIVWLKDELINQHNLKNLCKKLKQYCQMIIWADKNNPDFFDFFCESKTLELFFQIFVKAKYKQLIIQIIKGISILLVNLNKTQSIHYFLAHPTIKNFLIIKFPQMNTQVAQYYINFLKSLTQKLDVNTIHLLYNKKFPQFSLVWQTIRFYNHPQSLIRTTSRNIILTLIKLDLEYLHKYFCSFPFVIYYTHLSCFIKQYWINISQLFDKIGTNVDIKKNSDKMKQLIEDNYDLLLFIEDFLKMTPKSVSCAFLNAFIHQCINSLLRNLISHHKEAISINIILYIFGVMFKIGQNKFLLDFVSMVLFGRYTHIKLSQKINSDIHIVSHSKHWSFKGFWDKYDHQINQFNKLIFNKLDNKDAFSQKIKQISISQSQKNQQQLNQSTSSFSNSWSWELESKVFQQYQNPRLMKFAQQLNKIEQIHGFTIFSNKKQQTSLQILQQVLLEIKQTDFIDLMQFNQNPNKDTIFSFMSSKDDNLVMLTMELLLSFIKNKNISQTSLKFCGLDVSQKTQQQYPRLTFQKILKCCLNVIKVDPPNFRLFTVLNAIQLIKIITEPYQIKSEILNKEMNEDLIIALEVARQRVRNHLEISKQVIDIFLRSQNQYKKIRTKGLGAYGLLIKEDQIQQLYQKTAFTLQERIQRDFHNFFLIRQLLNSIYPKQFPLKQKIKGFQFHQQQLALEMIVNGINCLIRLSDKDKAQKSKLIYKKQGFCIYVSVQNDWKLRFKSGYTNVKIQFDQDEFRKLKIVSMEKSEIVKITVSFENARISASNKLRMQQQRKRVIKKKAKQIDQSLQ